MINIKINNTVEKLYDKYEIFLNKPLGSGTYSTVFMGRMVDTENIVAIKKIKLNNLDSRSLKLVTDEVNIMRRIMQCKKSCMNIIKCYDIIEEPNYVYFILEYCENGDMSSIIGKPIKENIVKYYFSKIVKALHFLYENNIIHRDIKPKNILLKNNKKDIVLCDFGFARMKHTMKRSTSICGSPLYMAPELLESKSYTEVVDIWAIGMILYEMIYGLHPYIRCKDIDDLKEFSKRDIKIPPEINNNINVSDECIDLMKKMLNKEESERVILSYILTHVWIKDSVDINMDDIDYMDDSD